MQSKDLRVQFIVATSTRAGYTVKAEHQAEARAE
jgi:hypothetical protein